MALELETQIMMEIGLGNHYSWYNGSASCRGIRIKAADKLHGIIQRHHDRKEAIAAPNYHLFNTLQHIANEGDDHDLTNTWVAASYIIAEHIHQAETTDKERIDAFENLNKYLKEHYISDDTEEKFKYDNYGNIIFYTLKSER